MNVLTVLLLIWVHTIADFALQTDQMAINKSSSNYWLFIHVFIYSLCFWPLSFFIGWQAGALFVLINFAAHFCTDYVTSRMTTKLWKAGKRHLFFVVIGIDQALHFTALVLSYQWVSRMGG